MAILVLILVLRRRHASVRPDNQSVKFQFMILTSTWKKDFTAWIQNNHIIEETTYVNFCMQNFDRLGSIKNQIQPFHSLLGMCCVYHSNFHAHGLYPATQILLDGLQLGRNINSSCDAREKHNFKFGNFKTHRPFSCCERFPIMTAVLLFCSKKSSVTFPDGAILF